MVPSADGICEPMPFHSIAIRIVSSYLQVAGLLIQFDLTLPGSVETLVLVEGSSSALSEQLLMFDCGTNVRDDAQLFQLRQLASVWLIPLGSVLLCALFWVFFRFKRGKEKDDASIFSSLDGFFTSCMVLIYTLFPSVINHVALTFSCREFGKKTLLTEALSVQCWGRSHTIMVATIGIPGMLLYAFVIPIMLAETLIRQRKDCTLYPSQKLYDPKWTMRLGFVYAGYREGYEWWESVIMARKCMFVLLSVYLRAYGPSPQVVSSAIVLVIALSVHLQYRPYANDAHNLLESIGIHACILQLLTALLCNMVSGADKSNKLGPKSTVVLVVLVFSSTLFFFYITAINTVRFSQETKGIIGWFSRKIHKLGCCKLKPVQQPTTRLASTKVTENDKKWAMFYEKDPVKAAASGYMAVHYEEYQKKLVEEKKLKIKSAKNTPIKQPPHRSVAVVPTIQLKSQLTLDNESKEFKESNASKEIQMYKNKLTAVKLRQSIRESMHQKLKDKVKASELNTSTRSHASNTFGTLFNSLKQNKSFRTLREVEKIQNNHNTHRNQAVLNIKRRQNVQRNFLQKKVAARKSALLERRQSQMIEKEKDELAQNRTSVTMTGETKLMEEPQGTEEQHTDKTQLHEHKEDGEVEIAQVDSGAQAPTSPQVASEEKLSVENVRKILSNAIQSSKRLSTIVMRVKHKLNGVDGDSYDIKSSVVDRGIFLVLAKMLCWKTKKVVVDVQLLTRMWDLIKELRMNEADLITETHLSLWLDLQH